MKFLQVLVYISVFRVSLVDAQACHQGSRQQQCSGGQICLDDICQQGIRCSSDDACSRDYRLKCINDFCQEPDCRGSCVFGQTCDYLGSQRCRYPIDISGAEGSDVTLSFAAPAPPGSYKTVGWYRKYPYDNYKIEVITPGIRTPCRGICLRPEKAQIDTTTGNLILKNLETKDEEAYFYSFDSEDPQAPNTGDKYVYRLTVTSDLSHTSSTPADRRSTQGKTDDGGDVSKDGVAAGSTGGVVLLVAGGAGYLYKKYKSPSKKKKNKKKQKKNKDGGDVEAGEGEEEEEEEEYDNDGYDYDAGGDCGDGGGGE